MTLKKTLEEMQGGLMLIMDAVKQGNTQEAEPRRNKSIALCRVEPLHRTCRHVPFSPLSLKHVVTKIRRKKGPASVNRRLAVKAGPPRHRKAAAGGRIQRRLLHCES